MLKTCQQHNCLLLKLMPYDELANDVVLQHEQESNINHYGWLGTW